MKTNKFLLMGLLASGLVLTSCGSKISSSNSEKTTNNATSNPTSNSETTNDSKISETTDLVSESAETNISNSSEEDEIIILEGHSFTVTSYTYEILDTTFPEDLAEDSCKQNLGSTVRFLKDNKFRWKIDLPLELGGATMSYGTYSQDGSQGWYISDGVISESYGDQATPDEAKDKKYEIIINKDSISLNSTIEIMGTVYVNAYFNATLNDTSLPLKGNTFAFKDIVEKDSNYDDLLQEYSTLYLNFKENDIIELNDHELSGGYSGTYVQNGDEFTYTFNKLNGLDIREDYQQMWNDLPGSIDEDDVIIKFPVDKSDYLNLIFTLTIGNGDKNEETTWESISYDEFKDFYDNRKPATYNYLEYKYGDTNHVDNDGNLIMYKGYEYLENGIWTVAKETEQGMGDVTFYLVPTEKDIVTYENPPAGYSVEFKISDNGKYWLHSEMPTNDILYVADLILDEYFYGIDYTLTTDGVVTLRCIAEWFTRD